MTQVRYHRLAEEEAAEALDWYESQQQGLGSELIRELKRAEVAISRSPETWPIWPETKLEIGIRRFLLSRFPFGVAYIIENSPIIIAVVHLRRRPLYWLDRAGDKHS